MSTTKATIRAFQTKDIIPKLWGDEQVIVNNDRYCGKILRLRPGYQSSLHRHPLKTETMYILNGRMQFESPKDHIRTVFPTDIIDIPPNVYHRFINPFDVICVFAEFSTPHDDSDVDRLEESMKI